MCLDTGAGGHQRRQQFLRPPGGGHPAAIGPGRLRYLSDGPGTETCIFHFNRSSYGIREEKYENEAYQKHEDRPEGRECPWQGLPFYGEESYLREYYLGQMRKALVPAGFEEFNYTALEGRT